MTTYAIDAHTRLLECDYCARVTTLDDRFHDNRITGWRRYTGAENIRDMCPICRQKAFDEAWATRKDGFPTTTVTDDVGRYNY